MARACDSSALSVVRARMATQRSVAKAIARALRNRDICVSNQLA